MIGFGIDAAAIDADDLAAVQQALDRIIPGFEASSATAHDWLRDEFSLGTWAIHRPGWYTHYHDEMRRPEGRMLLTGSDLANGWSGFIDGAIESGVRAQDLGGEVSGAGMPEAGHRRWGGHDGCGHRGGVRARGCAVRLTARRETTLETARRHAAAIAGASISAITTTTRLDEALDGAELVVETIVEEIEAKRRLLGRAESLTAPGAIIVTNTSSLPLAELSTLAVRPLRRPPLVQSARSSSSSSRSWGRDIRSRPF